MRKPILILIVIMVLISGCSVNKVTRPESVLDTYLSAWEPKTELYDHSKKIYMSWTTPSGSISGTICMNVTRTFNTTTQRIYGECISAPSGNMTYDYSAYTSGAIHAYTYTLGDGHK